jgi:hypothetical protein
VKGSLDNLNGQVAISNYKILLREAVKQVSEWEFVREE